VALLNKWTGIDGQDKNTTTSQIRQALVDLQEISNSTWDGGKIKALADGLKTTLESMTKAAAKDNPDKVKEALRATEVLKITYASAEAQGVDSAAAEAKSPSVKKMLPASTTDTIADQITAAAKSYAYNIQVYKSEYLNKISKGKSPLLELFSWWNTSSYKKGSYPENYAYAFLSTGKPLPPGQEVWATVVSFNKKMKVGGLVESVIAKVDANREDIRVATFTSLGKTALIAAKHSKEFARGIIWTTDEPSAEAASDYFMQFIFDDEDQHIYSPTSGYWIVYELSNFLKSSLETFSKA
jgi:hypothetical protein